MNKRRSFIALFLALATMASLAVTAVADGTDINNEENISVLAAVQGTEGVSFGNDAETGIAVGSMLTPDTTYLFPVFITDEDGNTAQMTEDDMDTYRITVKEDNGKENISSMELVKKSGKYSLEVVTKRQWPKEKSDVEYTIKVADRKSGKAIYEKDITFEVGYNVIDDAILNEAEDGGYIVVSNDAPVITKEQFNNLDDLVNGEKVMFSNDDWTYEVRVTSQDAVNMLNNNNTIKDIVTKFEDNQFKFVNFPGGPEFEFSGKVTINIYGETEDFDGFYVYRYYKGEMIEIDAEFDKDEDTLSFNTKSLGNFVITDKEIKDGTIIDPDFKGGDNGSTDNTIDNDKTNPSTGSASVVGAAAAMAVTAAAGVVLSKKSK